MSQCKQFKVYTNKFIRYKQQFENFRLEKHWTYCKKRNVQQSADP